MKQKLFMLIRLFVSIIFILMAMAKLYYLTTHGLSDYKAVVHAASLPGVFAYYGVVAMAIEFYVAGGVWVERLFKSSVYITMVLVTLGTILSIYFVLFKVSNECGCGLLGDSEGGLLVQKILIIILLALLWRGREYYFLRN